MTDPTKRFSSRVENYVKYRPGYPPGILDLLRSKCGLTVTSAIADIGSGTGIWTAMLLASGARVFGVEPNAEMRAAGERMLASYSNFTSINATAEATTLPDHSIDIITASQAFHWFDREPTRREFLRILKPGGWLVLIWNDRNRSARPFFKAYEDLLVAYGTDYVSVNHKNVDREIIGAFYGPDGYGEASYPNDQTFDYEGLKGRLLSSSYAPEVDHPLHLPMLEALQELFQACQTNGTVTFDYDTTVFYGQLS